MGLTMFHLIRGLWKQPNTATPNATDTATLFGDHASVAEFSTVKLDF